MHPAPRHIVRRQVDIDFASARAVGWNPANRDIEVMCNSISRFLPEGERYFVRSAAWYRDRIRDPQLAIEVEDFIHQEAMHAKEHARCNQKLDEEWPEGARIAQVAAAVLDASKATMPRSTQLATTCALEHFTAILADAHLRDTANWTETTDPAFHTLWSWHAAEEIEHKAVCIDLYRHVVGRGPIAYLHRVAVMFVTTLLLALVWLVGIRANGPYKTSSGQANPAKVVGKSVSLKAYFDYYRPGFHPWDHDNRDLALAWRERYAGFGEPTGDAPS